MCYSLLRYNVNSGQIRMVLQYYFFLFLLFLVYGINVFVESDFFFKIGIYFLSIACFTIFLSKIISLSHAEGALAWVPWMPWPPRTNVRISVFLFFLFFCLCTKCGCFFSICLKFIFKFCYIKLGSSRM